MTAVAAILTLSMTLGMGAAVLALVDAVLLTPPPFTNPDRLFVVDEVPISDVSASPRRGTYGTFELWRDAIRSTATLEAFDGTNLTLTGIGEAERLSANDVTPGFLRQLGVNVALGRTFEPADLGQPVVVLSDALWRAKLGADVSVLGRQIALGGVAHQIIGVLPQSFVFDLNPADVWRLIPDNSSTEFRTNYLVSAIARLGDDLPASSLKGALERVSRTSPIPARVVITPIATAVAGSTAQTLGMLGAAAIAAVLIAFINLGSLLVVRTINRQQEIAIRKALGASPLAIARSVLIETQGLVAIGVIGGILLALWLTPILARLALEQFAGAAQRAPSINWVIIPIMAIVASIVGCAAAVIPALAAARSDALLTLRRGNSAPPPQHFVRRIFVVSQVAFALVLLSCVSLLGTTLYRTMTTAPGFKADGVLALKLSLPAAQYSDARVVSFYSELRESLAGRLGPRSVALANEVPLNGSLSRRVVRSRAGDVGREAVIREISAGYFDVMAIPVVAGRPLDQRDDRLAPARVVISASLAAALPDIEQPIGRRIMVSPTDVAEVVGVVGDVKHQQLDEAFQPTVYMSTQQSPSRSMVLVVRSDRANEETVRIVREEAARLDPTLPVYGVRSMKDIVSSSRGMAARRVITATFIVFATMALVLCAIGLFAAAAHDALARRTEFAIRVALGAEPANILLRVLHGSITMLSAGLVAGSLMSLVAATALVAAGFGSASLTLVSIGLSLMLVTLIGIASLIPAIRAALSTDIPQALRS